MLVTGSSKGACILAQGTAFTVRSQKRTDTWSGWQSWEYTAWPQHTEHFRLEVHLFPSYSNFTHSLTYLLTGVGAGLWHRQQPPVLLFSHTFTPVIGQASLWTMVKAQSGAGKAKCSHLPTAVKLTWPVRPASRCVHGLFSHLNLNL